MNDSNNLNIALIALAHHLNQDEQLNSINHKIATAALAIYLSETDSEKSIKRIVAQIALALYLDENPKISIAHPKKLLTYTPRNSSWSSKALLLREMPARQ